MKHLADTDTDYAAGLLAQAGVEVTHDVLKRLMRHLDHVLEWNAKVNLTAVTDAQAAVRLHIIDSLSALPEVNAGIEGRLYDLGTGAGFPGLPLALATGRPTTLVDSVGKKLDVIQRFLVQENLDSWILVRNSRAELLADDFGKAAVVTARALSDLVAIVELATPLLADGGRLVALKGRLSDEELDRAAAAAEICGLALTGVRRLVLAGGAEERAVVVLERIGSPRVVLPRRVGMAQRRPLV